MQHYKELKVCEKAHSLTLRIYEVTKGFPKEELYCLTSQLRRACSSIPANKAEGCGKNSKSELAHFPNISLGSANDTEYFLLLAKDLNYLHNNLYTELNFHINEIKAMLISVIVKVRQ